MTLDEIREMWREDCVVDQNDLDTENFKCTVIHEKYLNIWSQFKLMLSEAEVKRKVMLREKFEYYSGKAPAAVYKEKPFALKVLKGDLPMYIDSDPDLTRAQQKIDYLETCINSIDRILKQIDSRGFAIKNTIEIVKYYGIR